MRGDHARTSFDIRLTRLLRVVGLSVLVLYSSTAASGQTSPLGMNLTSVSYFTPEQPFLNIFKTGFMGPRGWLTQGASWDTGEEQYLQLDADGWVTSLSGAGGQTMSFTAAGTLLLNGLPSPYYAGGQYVVLYDGQGSISYQFDAVKNTTLSAPGRDVLD